MGLGHNSVPPALVGWREKEFGILCSSLLIWPLPIPLMSRGQRQVSFIHLPAPSIPLITRSYFLKMSPSKSCKPWEGKGEEGSHINSCSCAPSPQSLLFHLTSRKNTILRSLQTVRIHVFENQASYVLERFGQATGLVLWTNSLYPAAEKNKIPHNYPRSPWKMSKKEKQPLGARPLWPVN